MSISRKNIIEKMIADDLKAEKIFRGGAGYKVVMVVKKLADLFLYCQSSTNKWDICAGEALMKGLGGYFTDENGNDFTYDHNSKDYLNPDGLLCGFVN
jgi:3'(2'), 5'-bisphosphate nucleotidase